MSILVIGQSAFLAQKLKNHADSKDWHFIGHKQALEDSWPKDIKTVINFAAEPQVKQGQFSDLDATFAQKAKDCGALYIMLSSRAVYGIAPDPATLTETTPQFETTSPYGNAKREIEQDLIDKFENLIILRPSNIFGFEYDTAYPRTTFMGTLLKSLKEEGVINFNMSAQTMRDFLPVEIFTEHLIKILGNPKIGIYNLGAGFGTQVGDIANGVIKGYGSGTLSVTDNIIKDSFVLDMAHTNATFDLKTITSGDIRKACVTIGDALRLDI